MKSKTNLELKHYCPDFNKIRIILEKVGAKKLVVKKQKDYFFNLPKNNNSQSPRLKLRLEKDVTTLVYYERPPFKRTKDTASKVKLYTVTDKQLLPFLEEVLGVKAIVEKKREVWKKANTVFHLDTIKGVGDIFEVELQKQGKITEKDHAIFKAYQDQLQPHLGNVIKGSNVDLVAKFEPERPPDLTRA